MSLFPIYVYKMLIYYERLSLFEELVEKEKIHNRMKEGDVIQSSFSYAIIMNHINVALYLFQKYKRSFTEKNEDVIQSIINILNEYTESNGAEKYKRGISHFEELLYFLDLF